MANEELKQALGDDLCDYCPWKSGEIDHRCDSLCEGLYCDDALDAFLDENQGFFDDDAVYKTEKGTPVTDSLKVSQVFDKQHKNVLKAIRNLAAQNLAAKNWFFETTYVDMRGQTQPMFIMTRDGFSLLAMGLTGAKAMQFKVAFIEQFNAMEKVVRQAMQPTTTPAIPQSFAEALRLAAAQAEQIERQQKQIEADAPRVLFSQAVETAKQSVLIGELAKIICQNGVQTGEKRLFQWMRDNGYLCQHGERYNQPTQKAMEMGLFEIKKTTIQKPNGDTLISNTTKVTGKGQVYFVNKFLHNNQKNLQP